MHLSITIKSSSYFRVFWLSLYLLKPPLSDYLVFHHSMHTFFTILSHKLNSISIRNYLYFNLINMLKRNLRKTWRKEKEKNPRRDDVLNLILYPAKDDKNSSTLNKLGFGAPPPSSFFCPNTHF